MKMGSTQPRTKAADRVFRDIWWSSMRCTGEDWFTIGGREPRNRAVKPRLLVGLTFREWIPSSKDIGFSHLFYFHSHVFERDVLL